MTLLLPTDGCPRCLTAVPVHPYSVERGGGSVVAYYACGCGHAWWTNWASDALDLPCPGCPECGPVPSEEKAS